MRMEKQNNKPFDGFGKPTTILAKILAILFLIGFSIYYFCMKNHELTINSALAIVLLGIGIDTIFLSVNLSIMINNIAKLRQAITGSKNENNVKEDLK